MKLSPEAIIAELGERRAQMGPMHAKANEVRQVYNGDIVVPLPEMDQAEKVAVANLAQLGIDQTAQRIASVMPAQFWPSVSLSKDGERRARVRRETAYTWWRENNIQLKLYRRARWLIAYTCAPVTVRPNADGLAQWFLREPLGTYPAPSIDPDSLTPDDTIFCYRRGRAWLARYYPEQMTLLRKAKNKDFECVEYVSGEQITLIVMGAADNSGGMYGMGSPGDGIAPWRVLIDTPNRTEMPLAVVPGRITLDQPMGQFDGMVGMYQMQAKLMALNVIATQRAIFPETWLVGDQAFTPEVLTTADPVIGRLGVVKGGNITTVRMEPTALANPMIDRIEYAERHTAGIPAEYGGSSTTNIRTGKRGDSVLSAVIDFPIQEAQKILEQSLEHENKIAVAIAKSYAGNKTFSMYCSALGRFEMRPNRDFETDSHTVRYAYAGADADRLTIAGLQRIGAGTLAKESFMEIDPLVDDVEQEKDRITVEALEAAFLSSIQTQAANPQGPYQPVDMARIMQLVAQDKKDLPGAVMQVQQEAQERQAAMAPPAPPGMAVAPEQKPGLSPLGAGIEAAAPIQDAGPSMGNLAQLFTQMRRPNMQLADERSPTAAETGAAR